MFSCVCFLHKYICKICSIHCPNGKLSTNKNVIASNWTYFPSPSSISLNYITFVLYMFITFSWRFILKWVTPISLSLCVCLSPPIYLCLCLCLWVFVWPKHISLNYSWNNSSCCSCSLRSELLTRFPWFTTICVPLPALL